MADQFAESVDIKNYTIPISDFEEDSPNSNSIT